MIELVAGAGDRGLFLSILSMLLGSIHSHSSPKSRKLLVTEFLVLFGKGINFLIGALILSGNLID